MAFFESASGLFSLAKRSGSLLVFGLVPRTVEIDQASLPPSVRIARHDPPYLAIGNLVRLGDRAVKRDDPYCARKLEVLAVFDPPVP